MASVINRPNGHRWIQFTGTAGKRQTLRLGSVNKKDAKEICRRVELLLAARIGATSLDSETAAWVSDAGDSMRARLAELDLIGKLPAKNKADETTLGDFIKAYLASRTDLKARSINNLEQARDWLLEYFKADRLLSSVTRGDADEYRLWLAKKLGENTVAVHCRRAKQFFTAAVRKKLLGENPFGDMKRCYVKENRSRDFFVSREDAARVLDACPGTQWKLIFALARFGGLRCPSEIGAMKWRDIDWDNSRFTVHSPKTEHHQGKESRIVPIFPELRPYLEDAKLVAQPKADYVITLPALRRDRYANLGVQMGRYVKRAGLSPWPKLFQNLRATRETELAAEHPIHVVCDWIGNSKAVAKKHYLQVVDSDFTKAISQPAAGQGAAKSEASAKQKAQRQAAAQSGILGHAIKQVLESKGLGEIYPAFSQIIQSAYNECEYPLPGQNIRENTGENAQSQNQAKQNAKHLGRNLSDRDLAKIITAWPSLPPAIRQAILAMVKAAAS
jgi:integrase